MINSGLWLLLIALALLLGWYLGYQARRSASGKIFRFHRDYIVGLNYLLSEESHKAVDHFIKMLGVDDKTVETHLALGSLFRRRGELDRAIRIHQNLVLKSDLDSEQRIQALIELGQDYLSAGVLDRAEQVFKEVIDLDDEPIKSLLALQDIFEREKNWHQAVEVAKQLELVSGKRMHKVIGQYYCELAQACIEAEDIPQALRELKQALIVDKNCARASLMKGLLEFKQEKYKAALKTLKRIESQNPHILAEAVDAIIKCHLVLNMQAKLLDYLKQLVHEYPALPIIAELTACLQKWQGDEAALCFIADYAQKYPSFQGLKILTELYRTSTADESQEKFLVLQQIEAALLSDQHFYRCRRCGFSAKAIQWQCPSCKSWEAMEKEQLRLSC